MTIALRQRPLSRVVMGIVKAANGAWFDPSDMSTLYQDAAGTTPVTAVEQPVGLMLDKSQGLMLGPELVTNGDFSNGLARWNASYANPVSTVESGAMKIMASSNGSNGVFQGQAIATVMGSFYKLTFDMVAKSKVSYVRAVNNLSAPWDTIVRIDNPGIGTLKTLVFKAISTTTYILFGCDAVTDGRYATFDNISVRELYGYHATQSVTAYRPTLKQDANGKYYLSSDNIDDYLNLPAMPDAVTYTLNENGFVDMTSGTILGSTPILRWRDKFYGAVAGPDNLTESACNRVEYYLRNKSQTILDIAAKGINDIGEMGKMGFGVGICPALPAGYVALDGTDNPLSQNHGNYRYSDGSIQCWIPAFWGRIGHPSNPTYATYGVNSVDIKPFAYFADVAAANAAGYFLPRCFIDGGEIKLGVFVDKYMCSNNGGIASSIKNGNPLSSAADHNPFAGLTGAPSNNYGGAWAAVKTRGSKFFVTSRFIYSALALLSLAHGQAGANASCAWYDAAGVINFPKGCNNNALNDTNDTAVTYTSDGYSNCGKTGSGVPFAKTTHNGQACGIADLNGLMWEISQGVTCIATSKTITGATKTNPVALTITAHGMTTGAQVQIQSVVGMTQLNDKIYIATVVDANTITLNAVDGTAFTAYVSGGIATYGTFYAAKESAVMANFTGGNTLATDHFGAVGVAANMDAFTPACFRTDYPNNAFSKKMGNSTNQALSAELTGNNAVLRSLGVPIALGASSAGSNLFGQDYLYQYIRNELCLLSGAYWNSSSTAGVWASVWNNARNVSYGDAGFRSARYI